MTISNESLRAVRTIVTHEHCPDGIASAILLHDALPEAEILFCQYGTELHREMLVTPGMLFCDFSPPGARLAEFVAAGAIVLDHHKVAREIVAAFGERGVFADEVTEPGVSGALLAYRHVWGPLMARDHGGRLASDFAHLAGVRDTWQRDSIHWAMSCAQAEALRFWPVGSWLEITQPFSNEFPRGGHDQIREMLRIGHVLVTRKAEAVARAVSRAWRTTSNKGTRILVFEGVSLSSDTAEAVGDAADLIIAFGYEHEAGLHKLILSTRSHTTFDCAALSKYFGGGGHTRAAGFSVPFAELAWPTLPDPEGAASLNPYAAVRDLVNTFERESGR
jgi:hypothetical protein